MEAYERLRAARERAGYATASDAARAHEWPIQTYLAHENNSRGIRPAAATKYARAFKVSAAWILMGAGDSQPLIGTGGLPPQPLGRSQPKGESAQIISGAQGQLSGPRDVKILGHARGGTQGVFVDNGNIQGYAVRPDVLNGSKDGYAIYCHDRSMEPAIHSGWLCYVDPARPVQPGDDVVIQLRDGQAYIKRYVRRTQRALICQQYNPAEPVEYPADQVRSVHLIVNANRVRT